ncbi:hypothetical protein [Thermobrachium celere]|uniref:Uncharacterized protein n=1 Tax=Thermobrachium celere DSM 8682 TaxID=941824 RepID=R7RPQ3_9CLOT|nr:hypothetical protein [Thermobrachium celere]CDF57356.1 hypothetical protein TCEL_01270 [Thermobrachium celere DSM 8682]
MGDNIDRQIDEFIKKLSERFEASEDECEFEDCFNEFVKESIEGGMKDKKISYNPCNACRKKQVIIDAYNRICNREYIPPYVDEDCRNYKLALVAEKVEEEILVNVFEYLIFRVSIREIIDKIDDIEWRCKAEDILISTGYDKFIEMNFGRFNKRQIIRMLYNVNYVPFDAERKRTLSEKECITMIKYYIVLALRDKVNESLFKILRLIELELEYKIAVIEDEIRYIIKCILQEILITPIQSNNYNINSFNVVGALTELFKIFDGVVINGTVAANGKHDQRSDFRHFRNTIEKYERAIRVSFDLLTKKIKQYGELIEQRRYIVGITGICERPNIYPKNGNEKDVIVPPKPIIILNPDQK